MSLKTVQRISLFQILITFLMILLGGVVHNTGSSMACPDWPTCFGTFFPKMEGGVLFEHSHRILGTVIGLLCIFQVVLTWKIRSESPQIFRWAVFLLILVIFQGLLGGLTVLMRLPPEVSTIHLGTAQIFFLAILGQHQRITWQLKKMPAPLMAPPTLTPLRVALGLLYLQILYGAAVRHFGYSAACGLGPDYAIYCMGTEEGSRVLWPSIGGSQFHMLHRILGVVVAAAIIGSTIPLITWAKRKNKDRKTRLLVGAAHLVVIFQVLVGVWTVHTNIETIPVTLHLGGATVLLGICFFLHQYLSAQKCAAMKRA